MITENLSIDQPNASKEIKYENFIFDMRFGKFPHNANFIILLSDISAIQQLAHEKFKCAFLSTASHQLKTPLNPILSCFNMLKLSAAQEQMQYIKMGKNSVKVLDGIIENSIVWHFI